MLGEMCGSSKSLYNCAVYEIRQHFFKTSMCLQYTKNCHIWKRNENYKMLQAGVAQQTMKVADRSFKSFLHC